MRGQLSMSVSLASHDWVEIALDYRCNLRCIGCRACDDTGEHLTIATALAVLGEARSNGVENLWIGGGEPTLHPDLCALVVRARALGFTRVLLQTNGVRLAYPKFADAIAAAGVTEVSFNVKSHRAEVNDRLTRSDGSYALLTAGVANVVARSVRALGDLLLTRTTAPHLAETIRTFAGLGITNFTLWMLSAADSTDPAVAAEVPRFSELPLQDAFDVAAALGVELQSLHTPPCTMPAAHRRRYLPARNLRLLVVDPSGRSFPLESSPLEGGSYAEGCAQCASRASCAGARREYLEMHGAEELIPL